MNNLQIQEKEIVLDTSIGIFRACQKNESGEMQVLTELEKHNLVRSVYSMYHEHLEEKSDEIW